MFKYLQHTNSWFFLFAVRMHRERATHFGLSTRPKINSSFNLFGTQVMACRFVLHRLSSDLLPFFDFAPSLSLSVSHFLFHFSFLLFTSLWNDVVDRPRYRKYADAIYSVRFLKDHAKEITHVRDMPNEYDIHCIFIGFNVVP